MRSAFYGARPTYANTDSARRSRASMGGAGPPPGGGSPLRAHGALSPSLKPIPRRERNAVASSCSRWLGWPSCSRWIGWLSYPRWRGWFLLRLSVFLRSTQSRPKSRSAERALCCRHGPPRARCGRARKRDGPRALVPRSHGTEGCSAQRDEKADKKIGKSGKVEGAEASKIPARDAP